MHRVRFNDKVEQPQSETNANSAEQAKKFANLRSAGRELAMKLEAYRKLKDVVVLAPVLGGVPVAAEVAESLGVPLDFIIIRRLLAPRGPGSQLCAVNAGGSLVIDDELPTRPSVPESALDYFIADALDGLASRERVCRGGHPPIDLAQKTIILVDCGIRTGLTMRAAIRALRAKEPKQIIIAVPVANPESRETIESIADEIVCLAWPQPFGNAGVWYADFTRPNDNEVNELLDHAMRRH
jgi:predicted phosphoribosyltransferase